VELADLGTVPGQPPGGNPVSGEENWAGSPWEIALGGHALSACFEPSRAGCASCSVVLSENWRRTRVIHGRSDAPMDMKNERIPPGESLKAA
jgi:hypothetical protein